MKQLFWILSVLLLACGETGAKERTVVEDSVGKTKRIIELNDTVINGELQTETLSITTFQQSTPYEKVIVTKDADDEEAFHIHGGYDKDNAMMLICIFGIVFTFGVPALIICLHSYFKYKNRKAQFRLVEQALANGQPIPEHFFTQQAKQEDQRSKGIKNIFLGIGLFIFLYSLTDEFGIACVGLLIMFMGFGQVIIYYTTPNKEPGKKPTTPREEAPQPEEEQAEQTGNEVTNV